MASQRASFGLRALKQHSELIPLVSIVGAAAVGCCGFMAYALYSKPDVRLIKSRGPAHEDVQPTELRKLVNIGQRFETDPEIEKLRREIRSFKY